MMRAKTPIKNEAYVTGAPFSRCPWPRSDARVSPSPAAARAEDGVSFAFAASLAWRVHRAQRGPLFETPAATISDLSENPTPTDATDGQPFPRRRRRRLEGAEGAARSSPSGPRSAAPPRCAPSWGAPRPPNLRLITQCLARRRIDRHGDRPNRGLRRRWRRRRLDRFLPPPPLRRARARAAGAAPPRPAATRASPSTPCWRSRGRSGRRAPLLSARALANRSQRFSLFSSSASEPRRASASSSRVISRSTRASSVSAVCSASAFSSRAASAASRSTSPSAIVAASSSSFAAERSCSRRRGGVLGVRLGASERGA